MKMASKVMPAIMLLFIFIGCATSNMIAIDQTGREVPMPHYMLRTMDGNYQVLFYWATHEGVEDLDGTILSKPSYFDFFSEMKEINPNKTSKITLTVEVINPKKLRYELWERTIIHDRNGNVMDRGGMLAYSNQYSRTFTFTMPIDKEIKSVEFGIDFVNSDGDPVVHIGDYNYEIQSQIYRKGGEFKSTVSGK
jgi:hypothetical protein